MKISNRLLFVPILLFMVIISQQCKKDSPQVNIKKLQEKDTIEVSEIFMAKLCLDEYDSKVLPEFFIVERSDTFKIAIDDSTKCVEFKAKSSTVGEKQYNGFVRFYDKDNRLIQEDFQISYFVKDSISN